MECPSVELRRGKFTSELSVDSLTTSGKEDKPIVVVV